MHDLVEGKRAWSPPEERAAADGFRSWHERGYPPHRDAPGLTQFVTFCLADSLPASRQGEWAALLALEDDREPQRQLEAYLDHGFGECWLRRPDLAALVEDAFRFFHGNRYDLRAWVVMPNHAHVLVHITGTPLSQVVHSWKRHTAREANRPLGRSGAFWAEDCLDTYMRDAAHEMRARRYLDNNPVKARLVREPRDWAWSSARFRDAFERLVLPPATPPTDGGGK
jgi:REP element-mobilizing transposase RayT